MNDEIEGYRNKFLKWKEAFESKVSKINLRKTDVMVSGGIEKDGLEITGRAGICEGSFLPGRCTLLTKVD